MNIYDESVSYQTQVRVPQVYAMMHQCRLLQHAYQYVQHPPDSMVMAGAAGISQRQRIWLSEEPYTEVVRAFQHAALANHFVCANWATCDELSEDDPDEKGMAALRAVNALPIAYAQLFSQHRIGVLGKLYRLHAEFEQEDPAKVDIESLFDDGSEDFSFDFDS